MPKFKGKPSVVDAVKLANSTWDIISPDGVKYNLRDEYFRTIFSPITCEALTMFDPDRIERLSKIKTY